MDFFNKIGNWFKEFSTRVKNTYNEISGVVSILEQKDKNKQAEKDFFKYYSEDRDSFDYGMESKDRISSIFGVKLQDIKIDSNSKKSEIIVPKASLIKNALISTIYYARKGARAIKESASFTKKRGNSR